MTVLKNEDKGSGVSTACCRLAFYFVSMGFRECKC